MKFRGFLVLILQLFQKEQKLSVMLIWGLLYHSYLKIHWSHKLGSFHTEVLQDLQILCRYFIFKFLQDIQIFSQQVNLRVAVHLLSFSEGYTFWKCCAKFAYPVSMKNKFKCEVQLSKFVEKWKKIPLKHVLRVTLPLNVEW